MGAKAAALLLLGWGLQLCAAQLPGMPLPARCSGALGGPAPRSDLNWAVNETKLADSLRSTDEGKVLRLSLPHSSCLLPHDALEDPHIYLGTVAQVSSMEPNRANAGMCRSHTSF